MEDLPGIREVFRLKSVDSTQALARKLAQDGSPEGTLVWADRQTRGRGRMGRRWTSGPGGLYVSLILRPPIAPKRLAELSLVAAEAVANAVASTSGLKTAVKPPNDVLAAARTSAEPGPLPKEKRSEFKKVCGILAEASGGASKVDWVVLGIGMNVNNKAPKTLPAASSLRQLSGQEFDMEAVLRRVLEEFQARYRAFLSATNGHIPPPDGEDHASA